MSEQPPPPPKDPKEPGAAPGHGGEGAPFQDPGRAMVPALESGAEWLRVDGDQGDVVMSSRVRLARNLAMRPFSSKATRRDRQATLEQCRDAVLRATPPSTPAPGQTPQMIWVDVHSSPPLERNLLVERHLISKNHAKGKAPNANDDPRGVAIGVPDERLSIMVNEEDHLRLQAIRAGLSLTSAWEDVDAIDDAIEARVEYAYSPRLGYLTACPTNVGTGLRMSAMLHLPGLRLIGDIDKVKRAAQDMELAVRGFYGEGSDAIGDLYQLSNQTTLGKSEAQVLHELEKEILPKIIEYERLARRELLAKRRIGLEDQVWRAWGMLTHARLLTTEEAMQSLSLVRMGVGLGMVRGSAGTELAASGSAQIGDGAGVDGGGGVGGGLSLRHVNQMMLLIQPAHLQRAVGRELDQEQRRVARASLLRVKLLRAMQG
jgi:protein arginine kinase